MQVQDVLRGAKEVLLTEGWTQGDEHTIDDNGRDVYCLSGAVERACWRNVPGLEAAMEDYNEAMNTLEAVIGRRTGVREVDPLGRHVIEFNDDTSRTLDEVIDLIDEAIAFWREEHGYTVALPDSQGRRHADALAQAGGPPLVDVEAGEVRDAENTLVTV